MLDQPGCKLSPASQSWTVLSAEPDRSQLHCNWFVQIEIDINTWGQNREKGQLLYAHVVWQQRKEELHLEVLFGAFLGPIPSFFCPFEGKQYQAIHNSGPLFALGMPHVSKSDEFSEKFQTAFDPSSLIFGKLHCKFFKLATISCSKSPV